MPLVVLRDLHKRFGATHALRGASLELEAGEVHALLGENGAGKTTLVRALYGTVRPDAGEIMIDGVPRAIRGPADALGWGIGLVHQHFLGVPTLSVAENLALGDEGLRGFVSQAELCRRAARVCESFGVELPLDRPASELAIAQQQRLEIVRALARGVRVLVLDEPTAVLAPSEVDSLLGWIERLRADGRTVVLISHKLEEIAAVCDRVTVLRAGRTVGTRVVAGVTADELGRWMVGTELPPPGAPPSTERGAVALRLRGVRAEGLGPIDLDVRAGEIVVLAGIDGNGQGPFEELLAGVRAKTAGSLEVSAPPIAVLPGDRQRAGLVLGLSVEENLVLPEAARGAGASGVFRFGFVRTRALREAARQAIERFAIRAEPRDVVATLSGGNQQKLCVARALRARPGVLVAVNPTRGLDRGAAAAVREELRGRAREGAAVLLVSTDLDEVLELGHRIAVWFRGELLDAGPAPARERIGRLMLGVRAV